MSQQTGRGSAVSTNGSARAARNRSAADIERDIETARDRLASTVDVLSERVKPANVVRRLQERIKAELVDESGSPRMERIGPAIGVVAALVLLRLGRARRARRDRRERRSRRSS